ncbi:putative penicillin-binding protein [Stachybotrys elegans]|uniref:Penicillin-binding protein n=1 Tax=Stachybotrys elegans TaxID=80388 RepID=A0A8K0SSP2_9HYPO|nr:putative penicillin-binding protein [Stachybotrys elegans]
MGYFTRIANASSAALFLAVAAAQLIDQAPLAGSAGSNDPFSQEFKKQVEATMKHWKVPGFSIGVIDGEDIFTEGFGIATFPDTPATSETLWYGASTTKAHLGAVIAYLIDNQTYPELSRGWETPISSIIRDDFVLQDDWATQHITLEDAVTHRTGMSRHEGSSMREIDGRPAQPRDIVRNLRNLPMAYEPRVKYSYCNLMFVTLAHAVETLTGKWLGHTLKELIWEPLGMSSTFFSFEDAFAAPEHLAAGYVWDEQEKSFQTVPFMAGDENSGAGAIMSNVQDYAKWVKCLLHEAAPFPKEVHKDIRTPRMLAQLPADAFDVTLYGLGWMRTTYQGHVVYMHSGGMHAYGAFVAWLPEIKYGVVSFGNTALTSNAVEEILTWHLISEKLGIQADKRPDTVGKWTKFLSDRKTNSTEAAKQLYPHLPDHPLPLQVNISQLVGDYTNAGYGTLRLREQDHPDKAGEVILVADRPEMTWRYRLEFHHVSADNWMVGMSMPGILETDYSRAWFRIGADGKPAWLEYELSGSEMEDGVIKFDRVG